MSPELEKIQQRLTSIGVIPLEESLKPTNVPEDFIPWNVDLSPSALYNCSTVCRKIMGIKTPEAKLVSVKRWVNVTPMGMKLPPGCFLSIKRKEFFVARPTPALHKVDFTLVMFPYGNIWSQKEPDVPITEEWLWSDMNGESVFEMLMKKDAQNPIKNYFAECLKFMKENPDQIGIHLKRKTKST